MKRLLALFIVLTLASTANATLSIQIDGSTPSVPITVPQGGTVTISVLSDNANNYLGYLILDNRVPVHGSLGNPHTYQGTDSAPDGGNAGESGGTSPISSPSWGVGYLVQALSIAGQVVAGTHHTIDYTAPMSDGTATLGLFQEGWGTSWGDELDYWVIVVPEPATMSLLALGGAIVLIRKRRS
jgi:hypothetical protein